MGAAGHGAGQTGQLCHLDAVAVIGRAADDPAKERDIFAALFDRDVVVLHALQNAFEVGQFVVVGGKQRLAAKPLGRVGDVLDHGAGNAHAVKCGRAAADLIQNDQTLCGGILQDLGHLGHLHHEGGLPSRQVIRCTDAGEDGVHNAHMAFFGRDEGADLRHQRNEGILTHVGRFTGHVRAGDDEAAVGGAVEGGIVWHEQAALEHLLDHRMTAFHNGQLVAVVHNGAAVVVLGRHLRQRRQHIQLGDGIGRPLDAVQLGADGLQQLSKKAVFQRDETLVGTEDLAFQLLEFLGDVALAAGERLLADVGLRHQIFVAVADLDEVAKDVVVADLQLGDAGLLPQAGLQLGQDALGVIADGTQLVHLGVVALGDDTAIL